MVMMGIYPQTFLIIILIQDGQMGHWALGFLLTLVQPKKIFVTSKLHGTKEMNVNIIL